MSYDLYFLVPEDRNAISIEEFRAYFGARSRYRIDGAQAIYANANTGVNLVFDYLDPEGDAHDMSAFEGEDDELHVPLADGWKSAHVSVSVNYLRPHVFGLEAAPEIEAIVRTFDLSVEDPQTDGMGRGAFAAEEFLRGWSEGNRLAYQAAVEHFLENNEGGAKDLSGLSTAEIERCWQWNFAAEALQERLDEGVSVPNIRFLRDAKGIRSYVVWTDAASTAIPVTDYVVLVRDELAPKRGLLRRRQSSVAMVPHDDVARTLGRPVPVSDHVEPYHLIADAEPSARILDLFESAAPTSESPELVPVEAALNQELLDEALQAAGQEQQ